MERKKHAIDLHQCYGYTPVNKPAENSFRLDWRRVVFSSSIGDLTRAGASSPASHRQSPLKAFLRLPVESLFATFFPGDCRICSDPLLNISRLPVCTDCLTKIKPFQTAQCDICGELLLSRNFQDEDQGSRLCGLCQQVRPTYVRAVSYGPYEGVLRDLVHLLKYERVSSAADVLGQSLAQAIGELAEEIGPKPVAVPVPLHSSKLHQRGFNQSERIASHAVRALRTSFPIEFAPDALNRK